MDKVFSFTVPAPDAVRLLAAYGSPEACFAEVRKVLADKVQAHEKKLAEDAVVYPAQPDFSGITGAIADAE